MKRAMADCNGPAARRPCKDAGECSASSGVRVAAAHKDFAIAQQHGAMLLRQLPPAAVEHVLERTLCEADAALHLTLHAMSLASQIYESGSADAADRALNIAEQALAATVQQLAQAQALVAHKVGQQQVVLQAAAYGQEEDADLQDTCSSSFSCTTSL